MCRRMQIPGVILISVGVGFLLSCMFGNGFFPILVGIILIVIGILLMQKCR